jgi:hypothetical protein
LFYPAHTPHCPRFDAMGKSGTTSFIKKILNLFK